MKTKDFYEILGVPKQATVQEIKKRYRELAKKHHPDANEGSKKSEEIFKTVTAAYETLRDKKKRQVYDRQRSHEGSQSRARARSRPRSGSAYSGNWNEYDFERETRSSHQEPFSRAGFQEEAPFDPDTPTRGFDLQFIIDVPLETVALGGKTAYAYEKYVNCAACAGTGKNGDGKCGACKGKRQTVAPVTVEVEIPPGVADQFTLRFENKGGEGKNGGPPGDLLLKINTLPHPRFKRVKSDIYAEVKIPPELAESGGTLEVKTLDAMRSIQVEEGTLTGEELRLTGEGAAILWGKKRGDFIIKFFISHN